MVGALQLSGWRHLLHHPWQSAMALVGITLGVAIVMAVDLANQSAQRAFELSSERITGRATHQILAASGSLDERLYSKLRTRERLRTSAPVVEGSVRLRGERFRLLGLDPLAERPLRRLLPGIGSSQVRALLMRQDALIMPRASADRLGIRNGDSIRLQIAGREVRLTLAGLIGEAGDQSLDGLLLTDIAIAQTLLQKRGSLSRIDLRLNPVEAEALAKRLPPGLRLEPSSRRSETLAGMSTAFQTNLTAMSLLALLVGGFLIYNAMTFSVLQRRTQFGTLRLLGVSRRELFQLILGEALVIGLIGSLLGLLLGYLLAQGLVTLVVRTINDLYFTLRVSGLILHPGDLLKGIALGLLATLAATLLPALEAARNQPVAVNRRSELEVKAHRATPWLALAGIGTAAAGGILLLLPGSGLLPGFIALFLLILGYCLCVPGVMLVATRLLQSLAARRGGIGSWLALRGISTSLSRTGLAVAALSLAVATTLAMGTMISSFRITLGDWLEQTLQGDIYVSLAGTSSERRTNTLPPALVTQITRLSGVRGISMGRTLQLELPAGPVHLLAIRMAGSHHRGFSFKGAVAADLWQRFRQGELILVSEPFAYREQLQTGDRISLPTPSGTRNFHIGGIFHDYGTHRGLLVIPLAAYQRHWRESAVSTIGLLLQPDYPLQRAMTDIRRLTAESDPAVVATANGEIRQRTMAMFDRTFTITRVLRLLVILVAFIGILSAFLAMQLERSREYAILRATGLTPGELIRLVLLQTTLLGSMAGTLALPLGWMMGEILIQVINLRSFGWTLQSLFPPLLAGEAVLLALVASLLAGLYPALRLSRRPPAAAMREE